MKIAVMQPYFFPYLGYYQLLHAADIFVILDDVSYSRRKWVRSNFIRSKNGLLPIGVPLSKASRDTLISDLLISKLNYEKAKSKVFKNIKQSYGCNANNIEGIIEILNKQNKYLIDITTHSLEQINKLLNFGCEILNSSDLRSKVEGRGIDYILNLCKYLDGSEYINLPGGSSLYNKKNFSEKGIDLNFIEMIDDQKCTYYFEGMPVSILDTISIYGFEVVKYELTRYEKT